MSIVHFLTQIYSEAHYARKTKKKPANVQRRNAILIFILGCVKNEGGPVTAKTVVTLLAQIAGDVLHPSCTQEHEYEYYPSHILFTFHS
jgi:hypothetical protein